MRKETLEKLHALVGARMRLEQAKYAAIRQRADNHNRSAAHFVARASGGVNTAGSTPSIQDIMNADKFSRHNLSRAREERRKVEDLRPSKHAQRLNLQQALRNEMATTRLLKAAAEKKKKEAGRRDERTLEALHQLKSRPDGRHRPGRTDQRLAGRETW